MSLYAKTFYITISLSLLWKLLLLLFIVIIYIITVAVVVIIDKRTLPFSPAYYALTN